MEVLFAAQTPAVPVGVYPVEPSSVVSRAVLVSSPFGTMARRNSTTVPST
ncbi:hypothetical protein OHA79_52630 (plasmid) [Streptomyces sp. NBC_00841]|nr:MULTISPECIES: hypothetical protein [unclassified Streptomyces]MCX4539002.1 hypothetical protein [Streptomyces sp. NBC_01669]WSA06116.1 hypothetical protein OHA79_52630 [Streptomyces sp. NBC_00841]